jgi:hypothetical protein
VEGELEEEGWAELLSPPQPIMVKNAHKIDGQARRVEKELAIKALNEKRWAACKDEGYVNCDKVPTRGFTRGLGNRP